MKCVDCGTVVWVGDVRWPRCLACETALEERAAIMEHDAKLPKAQAEQLAAEDVRRMMFREGRSK